MTTAYGVRMRAALTVLCWALAACIETATVAVGTQPLGAACSQISDCQAGLGCRAQRCLQLASLPLPVAGRLCIQDSDCPGFYCGRQGVCTATAPAALDAPCILDTECQAPLACAFVGRCSQAGTPGTAALGAPCASPIDCQRPYLCSSGSCRRLPQPIKDCNAIIATVHL